jgi:hypothetical protein
MAAGAAGPAAQRPAGAARAPLWPISLKSCALGSAAQVPAGWLRSGCPESSSEGLSMMKATFFAASCTVLLLACALRCSLSEVHAAI